MHARTQQLSDLTKVKPWSFPSGKKSENGIGKQISEINKRTM
jgi:hypothetical protein